MIDKNQNGWEVAAKSNLPHGHGPKLALAGLVFQYRGTDRKIEDLEAEASAFRHFEYNPRFSAEACWTETPEISGTSIEGLRMEVFKSYTYETGSGGGPRFAWRVVLPGTRVFWIRYTMRTPKTAEEGLRSALRIEAQERAEAAEQIIRAYIRESEEDSPAGRMLSPEWEPS